MRLFAMKIACRLQQLEVLSSLERDVWAHRDSTDKLGIFFGDWKPLRMTLGCLALTFVDHIPTFRSKNKKNIKYEIIFLIFKKYCNQF